MSILKPFFCYYGGKYRAAPHYPKPTHNHIIEPFAGAAGYATRYPDGEVTLFDSDPKIAGLWRYLIKSSPLDIMALPLIASGQNVNDLAVCEEAKWLIGFWLNKGAAQPCNIPSKWMRGGTHPNSYWGEVIRERIASQVGRIKHWKIVNASYAYALDIEATWFVDPPYQLAGKHYKHGASGLDFSALADWCRSRQGQVIVCENEGATWLPFTSFKDIKSNPTKGVISKEVIWTGDKKVCQHCIEKFGPDTKGRCPWAFPGLS